MRLKWLARSTPGAFLRKSLALGAVVALLIASGGVAQAQQPGGGGGNQGGNHGGNGGNHVTAPEINLGGIGSAVALLAGGLLLLADRRRDK